MSFQGLQERLAALQETTSQLKELIDRLASLKFEPGSVPLSTDEEDSVSGELSAEISQSLREDEEEQELLQEEVEYLRGDEHDRARLREGVEKIGKDLASCRLSFRKARLSAKNSLAQAQRLERELLIKSYTESVSGRSSPYPGNDAQQQLAPAPASTARRTTRHDQHSGLTEEDQQTVGASNSVTNALRQTHALIAAELERSEYAHQTLTESSAALKQLDESYTSLDGMLASSRELLGTLLRSQKSDTWYLQTTFYMLLVTGAWLVFRRLLYGPMWWLLWLPLRLLFGTSTKVGSAVIQGMSSSPGESGQVEVQQKAREDKDLPTANVGNEAADGGAEAVMEDINKVIDAVNEAEKLGNIPEDQKDGSRNTKKRMWEESEGIAQQDRPKDEL
ncbi:Sec20-domain-containing protein [Mariannaea sp. PMI_226]|nr:Sec20-domain-containing protein [Mariannaea sp. PMI_226]